MATACVTSKSVGGVGTTYLWDRLADLPQLVGEGTNGGTGRQDLLLDGVGSARGVGDGTGLVGSASYDAFGSLCASSNAGSVLGFTGQQLDSETGFTFLRSRYLDPSLGRFLSSDPVQPNAPGTQGYNLYAYVANNPTTWVDPSGESVAASQELTARCSPRLVPFYWMRVSAGGSASLINQVKFSLARRLIMS